MKYIGLFKWFDSEKGFGVISSLNPEKSSAEEIFFHYKNWKGKRPFYGTSRPIVFETEIRVRGGLGAINCSLFDCSDEHWRIIFSNVGNNLLVKTDYSTKDLLIECLNCIDSEQHIAIFVEVAKDTLVFQSLSISELLPYIKNLSKKENPLLKEFCESLLQSLPFNDRLGLYNSGFGGLDLFSRDEYLYLGDYLRPNDLSLIRGLYPSIYSSIYNTRIKADIDKQLTACHVCYNVQHNIYSCLDGFNQIDNLFNNYCAIISSRNEIDELKNNLIEHYTDLIFQIANDIEIIQNPTRYLKKIFQYPSFLDTKTKKTITQDITEKVIDESKIESVVELFIDHILPFDKEYFINNRANYSQEILRKITTNDDNLDAEDVRWFITDYFECSKDTVVVLKCLFDNRKYLDDSIIQKIQEEIKHKNEGNELSLGQIRELINYRICFEEGFIEDVALTYLNNSNIAFPIIDLIKSEQSAESDLLKTKLIQYHTVNSQKVDFDYANTLCSSDILNHDEIIDLINSLYTNTGDYIGTMRLVTMVGNAEITEYFESFLISHLSNEQLIELWEEKLCSFLPSSYFDDNVARYANALDSQWRFKHQLQPEQIKRLMLVRLEEIAGQFDHRIFKNQYYIFEYAVHGYWENECNIFIGEERSLLFRSLIHGDYIPFDLASKYFILFPDKQQIRLIKLLFKLKSEKRIGFTIESLEEGLTHNYLQEWSQSEDNKPYLSFPIRLIIKCLTTKKQSNRFPGNNDLVQLWYDLIKYSTVSFDNILELFSKCTGKKSRKVPQIEHITRYIYLARDVNKHLWYVVCFPYDPIINEEIRKINGCTFHSTLRSWIVPEEQLEVLDEFAISNKFLFLHEEIPANKIGRDLNSIVETYPRNVLADELIMIAEIIDSEEKMPANYLCDARETQNDHQNNNICYWCSGYYPCHFPALRFHSINEWEQFTLLDFCLALGIGMEENNKYGNFVFGEYAKLISTINRFKQYVEHLRCKDCGMYIYPVESNYSVNTSSSFYCVNSDCRDYLRTIYLNHCYSRGCRGIIDSRESKKCPNGLVICKECGTCCTTDMFRQRLDRLIRANSHFIPSELYDRINRNAGHKDHNEYYCSNCGELITQDTRDCTCTKCGHQIRYRRSYYRHS